MTLMAFFLLCIIAGLIFAVLSLIFAGGFGGEAHADIGGHADTDFGATAGEVTFSPVSPTVIATFITAFGAGGVVGLEALRWSTLASLGLAVGSGLVIAGLVYGVLDLIYKKTQGSSEERAEDLVGLMGEIITPIAPGGTGQIAYVARGSRSSASAKSVDGEAIGRGAAVEIVRVAGSTIYVKPAKEPSE